jgi:hypothetical protein
LTGIARNKEQNCRFGEYTLVKSLRTWHHPLIPAVIFLLFFGGTHDVPAQAPSGTDAPAPAPVPTGNFLSSVKQAFRQDFDEEVVRGHFDVGSPPDSHRYYCLVNPKTGKREENGVGGKPYVRRDGMTGIESGAVAFFSCVDAEQKGLLIADGYVLSGNASKAVAASTAPAVAPAPSAAAPQKPAPAPAGALLGAPLDDAAQAEIKAAYARFISGQNAHDPAVVSDVLLDSRDFVWAQSGGATIWGHKDAMDAFAADWKGTWKLDPQLKELRIANIAPGVVVMITPLLFTQGAPGEVASTVPIRWGGIFVKTPSGWRIASIFITPYKSWQPAG